MIARIWHGWASPANADELERLLIHEIIPAFQTDLPEGFHGIQVLRCAEANEVKFTTIMRFSSLESIQRFAGDAYQASHIDPRVSPLLTRYDKTVSHYQVRYSSY